MNLIFPSKTKAFLRCIGWGIATIACIPLGSAINYTFCGGWGWIFLILSLWYGGVWLYKLNADQQLAERAQSERILDDDTAYPQPTIQQTSPGSGWIGLPDGAPPEGM